MTDEDRLQWLTFEGSGVLKNYINKIEMFSDSALSITKIPQAPNSALSSSRKDVKQLVNYQIYQKRGVRPRSAGTLSWAALDCR